MATSRKPAASKPPAPAKIVGDLNSPYLSVKFGGILPDLIGVGDNWTVELASKYLAAVAKDSVPAEEVQEIFVEAFGPSNPDMNANFYPLQTKWDAVQSFFAYRLGSLTMTTEIVRNQPLQIKRASSG
jgi:hypothetical protein